MYLTAIKGFESAKALDAPNEAHPETKKTLQRRGSRRFSKTSKMTSSSQLFRPMDIVIDESEERKA
eukprot:1336399-Amorphochlora_amoeboformis.AAC.1